RAWHSTRCLPRARGLALGYTLSPACAGLSCSPISSAISFAHLSIFTAVTSTLLIAVVERSAHEIGKTQLRYRLSRCGRPSCVSVQLVERDRAISSKAGNTHAFIEAGYGQRR